jgi:hypothetical protein
MSDGVKEDKEKLYYELDWEFVEGMAERMNLNKGKYPRWNWMLGMDISRLNQAMIRHFVEIQKQNISDEQDYGHYYALACNAMMIIHQLKKEKEDGKNNSNN